MVTQSMLAVLTRVDQGGFILHPMPSAVIPDIIRESLGVFLTDDPAKPTDGCQVRVLFHQSENSSFSDLGQSYLKAKEDQKSEPFPIIHILFGVDLIHPETDSSVVFPRSARFLDSSIWNYCVWHDEKGNDRYKDRIARALREIHKNWELKLYGLGTTMEYADLNARLSENAFFKGGHHSERVSPFLFHSEFLTRETLESKLGKWKGGENAFCFGHRWRFLLVDDHAGTPLSARWVEEGLPGGPTKLDIILARLRSLSTPEHRLKLAYRKSSASAWEGDIRDYDIAIDCVSNIQELTASLFGEKKKRYDIVLMDYLLGDSEYSYDFFYVLKSLRDILELDNPSNESVLPVVNACEALPIPEKPLPLALEEGVLSIYGTASCRVDAGLKRWILDGIGPMERLYFMYISSFVHAIQERLEEQRLSRADKYWYVGRGACPVNTPEIFLFNLRQLMEKRLSKIVDIGDGGRYNGVSDFVFQLFHFENGARGAVKYQCRSQFPKLLKLKDIFANLARDVKADETGLDSFNSTLLDSVFKDRHNYTPEFWEHLQHLCYLVSFGTERQWPELWEEFLFVHSALDENALTALKNYINGIVR